MCSVGGNLPRGKSQNLVAWTEGKRSTESLKPIDKAIFMMVSKSSGRNNGKHKVPSQNSSPKAEIFAAG